MALNEAQLARRERYALDGQPVAQEFQGESIGRVGHLGLATALTGHIGNGHRVRPTRTVLEHPLPRLITQIQPRVIGMPSLQQVNHAQALSVVIESAVVGSLLLPWFLYSWLVFGDPFPATLQTKIAMGESGVWKLFFPGSQMYLTGLTPYQDGFAFLFLPILLLGLWRSIRTERIWLFFVGMSFLFAVIYQWVLASASSSIL